MKYEVDNSIKKFETTKVHRQCVPVIDQTILCHICMFRYSHSNASIKNGKASALVDKVTKDTFLTRHLENKTKKITRSLETTRIKSCCKCGPSLTDRCFISGGGSNPPSDKRSVESCLYFLANWATGYLTWSCNTQSIRRGLPNFNHSRSHKSLQTANCHFAMKSGPNGRRVLQQLGG